MEDDRYDQWRDDAELLAEIGRALLSQETRIRVRLPRDLAERAVLAWQREADDRELPPETPEQQQVRHHAGTAGLIGLSIEQEGRTDGNTVVVELDAWHIGDALGAADDAGYLTGLEHPPTE